MQVKSPIFLTYFFRFGRFPGRKVCPGRKDFDAGAGLSAVSFVPLRSSKGCRFHP